MTVASTSIKAGPFDGNDVATTFPFTFSCFAAADLRVVEAVVATGVETDLVLDSGYSVALNADQEVSPGGSITYKVAGVTTALPSTKTLVIISNVDNTQPTHLPDGGSWRPKVVERALDRLTLQVKQITEEMSRVFKVDVTSDSDVDTLLASVNTKAAEAVASAAAADVSADAALVAAASVLSRFVSVKDFGAVCDGVTDDSTADAAAVSAVKALGGGVVHYPGKTLTGGAVQRGGMRFVDENFPSFKRQSRWAYRADITAANGEGTSAFQALSINGTLIPSTLANFLATAVPDVVTFSGWGLRGSGGTNPLVCSNFGAWFENNTNIVWAQEIDVNNEGATQAESSDYGGVGVAINTGSTYSPDTGIAIRRFTGAGTGPGFLRGILIAGARNTGIRIEAMDTTTYPSLSPAAPGTIQALQVLKSGDSNLRWMVNESGGMSWGSGAAAADVTLSRTAVGVLTVGGAINDTVAWSTTTPTPTAGSGSFTSASATVRYNQIGKRVFGVARAQITTNGTAAGNVTIPLPINASTTVPQTAAGRERGVSGKALVANINATTMTILNYDNTYPGADGADIVVQFMYEAA